MPSLLRVRPPRGTGLRQPAAGKPQPCATRAPLGLTQNSHVLNRTGKANKLKQKAENSHCRSSWDRASHHGGEDHDQNYGSSKTPSNSQAESEDNRHCVMGSKGCKERAADDAARCSSRLRRGGVKHRVRDGVEAAPQPSQTNRDELSVTGCLGPNAIRNCRYP